MVGHNLEWCWNWNIVEYSKFWLFLKLLHNYNITTIEKTGTPGLLFVTSSLNMVIIHQSCVYTRFPLGRHPCNSITLLQSKKCVNMTCIRKYMYILRNDDPYILYQFLKDILLPLFILVFACVSSIFQLKEYPFF